MGQEPSHEARGKPASGKLVCPAYPAIGIPALYVHDLTGTSEVDRLLRKPPPIHPAAPNVLSNLRKWNPEVASAFSEKDNAVKGIPFKVVTRSPIWKSYKIDSFVAISYSWHNDAWAVPERFADQPDDWSFPVCPAMLRALLSCVNDESAFWMDQLSIDQENPEEKARVIAAMDTLCRNASRVLMLLEDLDIAPDVEQSLRLLASTPSEPENVSREHIYLSEDALAENFSTCFAQGATTSLFDFSEQVFENCRWFKRAWCRHEYQLNINRMFCFVGHKYPGLSFDGTFFHDLLG
jgi:hypothetical protein